MSTNSIQTRLDAQTHDRLWRLAQSEGRNPGRVAAELIRRALEPATDSLCPCRRETSDAHHN